MATQGATAGYAAGEQTNALALLYAQEVNAGSPPGGAWQKLRYTGESLTVQDTTSVPDEINDNAEDAETVLTGRATSGNANGVLSYGTYDDFLAGVMSSDWKDAVYYFATKDNALRVTAGLFVFPDNGRDFISKMPPHGMIRLVSPSLNINYYGYYDKIVDPNTLHIGDDFLLQTKLNEGWISDAVVSVGGITNGVTNKTFSVCKPLASQFQIFTMLFVNQLSISMQKGQTPTVQTDFTGSDMQITASNPAASVTPANSNPIMDVVSGFKGLTIFGNTPAGCVQSATLTLKRNNSGQDTGMGHVGACGVQFGSFAVTLDVEYFFKDYQQFMDWQSGKKGQVSLKVVGADGFGYVFTIANARIFNPQNPSDAKNKTIVTKLSIVGNPASTGGTFGIMRVIPG